MLFIIDITEQETAEQMRREFSANVSHELKTPLTSVMGAAELIETGLAKREDIPHFAGKMRSEAHRLGFDMLCEEMVLQLREKHPQIRLHIILPCPETEQTEDRTETNKERYRRILLSADKTEICSEHYTKNYMKKRNARLAELADVCVCYYNENDSRSGTGQTVRMAREKEIETINICI